MLRLPHSKTAWMQTRSRLTSLHCRSGRPYGHSGHLFSCLLGGSPLRRCGSDRWCPYRPAVFVRKVRISASGVWLNDNLRALCRLIVAAPYETAPMKRHRNQNRIFCQNIDARASHPMSSDRTEINSVSMHEAQYATQPGSRYANAARPDFQGHSILRQSSQLSAAPSASQTRPTPQRSQLMSGLKRHVSPTSATKRLHHQRVLSTVRADRDRPFTVHVA